jgi:DNA-directed RNA polymerase subunit L
MDAVAKERIEAIRGYVDKVEVPGDGTVTIWIEREDHTYGTLVLSTMMNVQHRGNAMHLQPSIYVEWKEGVALPDGSTRSP